MSDVAVKNYEKFETKPLSKNGFLAFFQKIWRWWLSVWYKFEDKRPKLAKLVYQIFFFIVFSQGVTIYQYLIFAFLPNAFGLGLASKEWLFPGWEIWTNPENGEVFRFALLGKTIVRNTAGKAIIGGGLGYFFAFLIATFTAQCINFPLQRNITFKSKGNPWYQAMWYFIGWVLIQPFCDALISLYQPLVGGMLGFKIPNLLKVLLDTIIMGGVSMVIFFFVFLVIFPDINKMAKSITEKLEKKKAILDSAIASQNPDEIAKAQVTYDKVAAEAKITVAKANIFNAEKAMSAASTTTNAKMLRANALINALEKAQKNSNSTPEAISKLQATVEEHINIANEAIVKKDQIIAEQTVILEENKAILEDVA